MLIDYGRGILYTIAMVESSSNKLLFKSRLPFDEVPCTRF